MASVLPKSDVSEASPWGEVDRGRPQDDAAGCEMHHGREQYSDVALASVGTG